MGFFDWLARRLFKPENIEPLIDTLMERVNVKNQILEALADEEVAAGVTAYTDALYGRYLGKSGKLWSSIGGIQKGINHQGEGIGGFLSGITGEDDLSLASLAKLFFASKSGSPSLSNSNGSGVMT